MPWLLFVFAGLILLISSALAVWFGDGSITYQSNAYLSATMPPRAPETGGEPEFTFGDEGARTGVAAPVEWQLVEPSPFGPLPIRGEDGSRALVAYAHPFSFDDPRPRVAIVLLSLGLEADVTRLAIDLPSAVSLAFSPYASDVAGDVDAARLAGHETLLELPMEPSDYPNSDPGPHTLLAALQPAENLERLRYVMAQAVGYVALVGEGGRFASQGEVGPVLAELAERGVGLVDAGEGALEAAASVAKVPYAWARFAIDAEPSILAIDFALARLENQALTTGRALGLAQPYPITLRHLEDWIETLDEKGLVLAPASAIIRERAGIVPLGHDSG